MLKKKCENELRGYGCNECGACSQRKKKCAICGRLIGNNEELCPSCTAQRIAGKKTLSEMISEYLESEAYNQAIKAHLYK